MAPLPETLMNVAKLEVVAIRYAEAPTSTMER
jgi:hypothetical protein